jgi:hypothetical protein
VVKTKEWESRIEPQTLILTTANSKVMDIRASGLVVALDITFGAFLQERTNASGLRLTISVGIADF